MVVAIVVVMAIVTAEAAGTGIATVDIKAIPTVKTTITAITKTTIINIMDTTMIMMMMITTSALALEGIPPTVTRRTILLVTGTRIMAMDT